MSANNVESYGWQSSTPTHSTGYIAPRVKEILRELNVKRISDLGAGNGGLCGELLAEGYQVIGIEYDEQGVQVARLAHPAVKFYNYGVQDDPAELLKLEQPFEAVISTEVIEHLYSPHLLPKYAAGVLKSGGYLIVSTPYHGYLKNLALSLFNKWDKHHTVLWHGGHIKFWSEATLSELLEANGFEVQGFSGVGRLPYLWKSMILVARKK